MQSDTPPLPASLAHELRGPLHLMLGYARLLAKDAGGDAAGKLAIIEKNGAKLLQLIESALGGDQSVPGEAADNVMPLPAPVSRQRCLLIVDDVPENGDLLRDLCSLWGYRVILALNGADALAICRCADPVIDAVLVDQFMPVMDGWGFLHEIRKDAMLAELPVILISAAQAQRPQSVSPGLAFSKTITKPLDAQVLSAYLRQLFGELSSDGPEPAPVVFPVDSLDAFRTMLALGQIVAIRQWAEALALTRPDCAGFAAQVKQCCQSVDLAGLRRLLEQATIAP